MTTPVTADRFETEVLRHDEIEMATHGYDERGREIGVGDMRELEYFSGSLETVSLSPRGVTLNELANRPPRPRRLASNRGVTLVDPLAAATPAGIRIAA